MYAKSWGVIKIEREERRGEESDGLACRGFCMNGWMDVLSNVCMINVRRFHWERGMSWDVMDLCFINMIMEAVCMQRVYD